MSFQHSIFTDRQFWALWTTAQFRLKAYCVNRNLFLFNKFIRQFRIVVALYKILDLIISSFLAKSEIT